MLRQLRHALLSLPCVVLSALGCKASRESSVAPSTASAASAKPVAPSQSAQPPPAASVHKHEHGHKHDGYHMDFSQVEHFARHFDGPERDAWQMPAHVLELMNVQPGQTVADIGTGTGYFIGPLAKVVGSKGRVLALDVEPNMVRYVEERSRKEKWTNVEARVVAGDDPKLAAESVDGILIVNTWHHIDQRPTYARKLARALRPAGAVFVVDFTKESDVGPPAEHRLSADEVIQELREAGLNPSVMTEKLPKHYVVRATL